MNHGFNTGSSTLPGVAGACCAPRRPAAEAWLGDGGVPARRAPCRSVFDLVPLDGGAFTMGSDDPAADASDLERPARVVAVEPFSIAATTVTNAQFAAFVEATGHRTTAERAGWSFVFGGLLPDDIGPTRGVAGAPWWRQVGGATWEHPEGPASAIEDRLDHPVVHVSRADAEAFCTWADVRLPTEREWEYAARGGLDGARYPWGDELTPDGRHMCNIWQGTFPTSDTGEDGWIGTAPVWWYPPNGHGIFQAVGNVWEWCAGAFDPRREPLGDDCEAVVRGGSYLCHVSYCSRYRVSARSRSTRLSTTGHTGFRIAA